MRAGKPYLIIATAIVVLCIIASTINVLMHIEWKENALTPYFAGILLAVFYSLLIYRTWGQKKIAKDDLRSIRVAQAYLLLLYLVLILLEFKGIFECWSIGCFLELLVNILVEALFSESLLRLILTISKFEKSENQSKNMKFTSHTSPQK